MYKNLELYYLNFVDIIAIKYSISKLTNLVNLEWVGYLQIKTYIIVLTTT